MGRPCERERVRESGRERGRVGESGRERERVEESERGNVVMWESGNVGILWRCAHNGVNFKNFMVQHNLIFCVFDPDLQD